MSMIPSILGYKPYHDGTVALLQNGHLEFSIEAEKDSNYRHQRFPADQLFSILTRLTDGPDVIALGGWTGYFAGYEGIEQIIKQRCKIFGRDVTIFSSSHERSHLLSAYALSPFPQGQPCYALVWEGTLGCFYYIDENLRIHRYPDVMMNPGWRYVYPYYLASPTTVQDGFWGTIDMAGKMMALAGWPDRTPLVESEQALINWILDPKHTASRSASVPDYLPADKNKLPVMPRFVNGGLERPEFRNIAAHLSDALFAHFLRFAEKHLTRGFPLLISGGCGLNCEWNSKWKASGLFSDVFVPPCTNDSGSAIGTAVDAQFSFSGRAKISWSVYAGEEFNNDCPTPAEWTELPLDLEFVSRVLDEGHIVAWVNGRYEMGPRALGNRSLLAEPRRRSTTERLNSIKQREQFRPIAPMCLRDDASKHFRGIEDSPFMLYFQKVNDPDLRAVTHDDGSARIQTITKADNAQMHALLTTFKKRSGVGVLCNTSLNFKGRGFINRKSHLLDFANKNMISCVVINQHMLTAGDIALQWKNSH